MQRHCEYCMHKDNRDYKNVEQRRDKVLSLCRRIQVCTRRQSAGAEMHSRGMVH
jgi:hypothetical protein